MKRFSEFAKGGTVVLIAFTGGDIAAYMQYRPVRLLVVLRSTALAGFLGGYWFKVRE